MKFRSAIVGEGSGSLAGVTVSHNAGGYYMRQRVVPTNPQTLKQVQVRQALTTLTSRWKNILTAGQRAAWQTYASNVKLPDVLGDLRNRSALNHYVRSNVAMIAAGKAINDDAPVIFNLGEFTMPVVTASEATQKISVAFDINDEWDSEDASYMLVYASKPQNDSINFFKGPYQFMGAIQGNSQTPSPSPEVMDAPFAFEAGQKVFCQVCVVREDGRVSSPVRTFCVAAA